MDRINAIVASYCEGLITEIELRTNLVIILCELSEKEIKTLALLLNSMANK